MPVVAVTLEETERSVLSSVYYKIIEDVADTIKLPKESLVVLYKNKEVARTDNQTNVTLRDTSNLPTATTKRRFEARIQESYNEDHLDTTAVTRQEFYPIFHDPEIAVQVAPVYIQTDVEIEFKFVTPSKSEVERIRDDIRLRLSQHRSIGHHQVEYNIILPTVVEDFIADVHTLKNRLKPQELGDYFMENSTKRIHQITDLSNEENIRLAVHEKQVRIVGIFDFTSMPEKAETDGDSSTHSFSFTYKFSFTAPKAMTMRYPVMICNRVLPAKYVSFIEENKINSQREYKKELNYIGTSLADLSHFEAHRQLENRVDINVPINVPLFDDFAIRQGHKGYGIVISFLTEVDETDKRTLLNLKDLDPYYIPDKLLNHIRTVDRVNITRPYASFMYLGVYQEGRYFDNPLLEIDEDLNVKSKVDLDLFRPTRVTLSMCIDISMLNKETLDRIELDLEVLETFVCNYISAFNTYKNEMDRRLSFDNSFITYLFTLLDRLASTEEYDTIKRILGCVSRDNYISTIVGDLLINGYPSVLERINVDNSILIIAPNNRIVVNDGTNEFRYDDPLSKDTLERNEYIRNKLPPSELAENPPKDSRHKVYRGGMKTVMQRNIIALRKTE